jgi:hypothetical protein
VLPAASFTIAGVAEDVAFDGLIDEDSRGFVGAAEGAAVGAARHDIYVPLARFPNRVVSIGAATAGDPAALLPVLRQKLAAMAPASAAHWISTMDDEIALEYESTRFSTILVIVFSLSALALTSVGVFALVSHAAARRTPELGLRLALGASRRSLAWLLVHSALRPIAAGALCGGLAMMAVGRLMQSMTFGIGRFDRVAFAGAGLVLFLVTLGAVCGPLFRAARIDPLRALRES